MSFTRQMQPKGLGHAVWCARDIVGHEPFAVILPDVIVDGKPGALKQLADVYAETGGNVIGVEQVPDPAAAEQAVRDGDVDAATSAAAVVVNNIFILDVAAASEPTFTTHNNYA